MLGALPVHAEPAALASLGPLIGLAALGAFHGVNPAMGWLFAVSLGLQRQAMGAVFSAAFYIAVGHIASLAVVAIMLALAGYIIPLFWVRIASGIFLVGFGIYKLVLYYRHFRWVGMNVSGRDLVAWSFLMATSHGAGLMLAPIILNLEGRRGRRNCRPGPPRWPARPRGYGSCLGDWADGPHRRYAGGDAGHRGRGLQEAGAILSSPGLAQC